jgi:hypothetical protein
MDAAEQSKTEQYTRNVQTLLQSDYNIPELTNKGASWFITLLNCTQKVSGSNLVHTPPILSTFVIFLSTFAQMLL